MALWGPEDIDPTNRDEIGEKDDEWCDDLMDDLERRFNKLKHFNARLETSPDKDVGSITLEQRRVKKDTIELVANQMYDKITKLFNKRKTD